VLPRGVGADGPQLAGARLTADFDPISAMWLGYDAGHEDFTGDLAQALWPHVPIRMLVTDAQAQARAAVLLGSRGLDAGKVQFFQDAWAPFFLRDAAVFGADGDDEPFIVDFQWTRYGWPSWCRRRHAGNPAEVRECVRTDDLEAAGVDQRMALALDIPSLASPLAMEGGGIEVNGQGLVIANLALWRERNRGMSREAIEKQLLALPGMRKVIWLPFGLAHDTLHRATITGSYVGWGTGGHTDEFVRFADESTVLLAWADEADANAHPVTRLNRQRMLANLEVLQASTDQRGRPLRVVKVPLPRTVERPVQLSADADIRFSEQWTAATFLPREGRREGDTVIQLATTSYLNHVVANGLVLLPDYVPHGTPPERQERVRKLYASAFPGRKIAFIDCMKANWFGGGAHCASLGQPGTL
jgi:agmatine deiminase